MRGMESDGSGIIRMASPIKDHWIQNELKLLKILDIDELCGREPIIPKVGQKREAPEKLIDEAELKKQKLLELKARFANRKNK